MPRSYQGHRGRRSSVLYPAMSDHAHGHGEVATAEGGHSEVTRSGSSLGGDDAEAQPDCRTIFLSQCDRKIVTIYPYIQWQAPRHKLGVRCSAAVRDGHEYSAYRRGTVCMHVYDAVQTLAHARSHLFSYQPASDPDELPGAAALLGVRGHKLQEGRDVVCDGLQELRTAHDRSDVSQLMRYWFIRESRSRHGSARAWLTLGYPLSTRYSTKNCPSNDALDGRTMFVPSRSAVSPVVHKAIARNSRAENIPRGNPLSMLHSSPEASLAPPLSVMWISRRSSSL